jgi:hypothetical protein
LTDGRRKASIRGLLRDDQRSSEEDTMSARRPVVFGLIALVVGMGVTAASVTTAAARQDLRVTTTATAINDFVDVDANGPSPGDVYVFVEDVFDTANTRIGSAEGRCNLINPASGRFECTIVTTVTGGSITTDGILVNQPGATSTGAITGGTGRYAGAEGEATLVLGGPAGPHQVTFHFTG